MVSLLTLPSYHRHAQGQGIPLIRDTEAERVLRAKLDPILITAGLVAKECPAASGASDPSIMPFVAEGRICSQHRSVMTLDTPIRSPA